MNKLIALLILTLAACGDNVAGRIPGPEACGEQADAWCAQVDSGGGSACQEVYQRWYCRSGTDVDAGAQDDCLQALADFECESLSCSIPNACRAAWPLGR